MTRAERAAQAAKLRATGLNGVQIAGRMGISRSYAAELLTDPMGAVVRARKRRYDLVCVGCGGRVDGTSPGRMASREDPVCRACAADGHYATWTREAIVCCIQEFADATGGIPPVADDFVRRHALGEAVPSVTCVQGRFGSWSAAIAEAGFEPRSPGMHGIVPPLTAGQREACVSRYAAGESSVRIAADLGCAPPTVIRWVRAAGVPVRPPAFGKRAA